MKLKKGFVLVEAVAALVIASVALVVMAQQIGIYLKTGLRFREITGLVTQLENQLAAGWVSSPEPKAAEGYVARRQSTELSKNLIQHDLVVAAPGAGQGINTTTFVYEADH